MKILVADDSIGYRIFIRECLEQINMDVIMAKNGKIAIEKLEKHPDTDAVLMDIEMPVLNGRDATRRIREHKDKKISNIPVLGITAHQDDEFTVNLKEYGFTDFISKDITPDILHKKLQQIVKTKNG